MESLDIPFYYFRLISAITERLGGTDTTLHMHAGMTVMLLGSLLTRKSLASTTPFLLVVLVELLNEILNRLNYGGWRWHDTLEDVTSTLFWPMALMLTLRLERARNQLQSEPSSIPTLIP
jgi:hypothetical protein